ncbi:MAG: ATP-dependent Clp protease adapter ClpS [Spirochaetaceae bacterium]|nr:ATP-dependent Clp protease adapter ClpS [Spirochaetaceae bacterium]
MRPAGSACALFFWSTLFILVGVSIDRETEGGVLADEETDVQEPEEYRVILLNDDYTTMEFVVAVIISVFHKDLFEATRVMLDVHRKGRGVVGTYTYDIAATKVSKVHEMARENGFPLKCVMEKA